MCIIHPWSCTVSSVNSVLNIFRSSTWNLWKFNEENWDIPQTFLKEFEEFFHGQPHALLPGYIIDVLGEDGEFDSIKTTWQGNYLCNAISLAFTGKESIHIFP